MDATGGSSMAASATQSVARHRQLCWLAEPTHRVNAKVSIHVIPGPRPTAWRHQE